MDQISQKQQHSVSFSQSFRVWCKIALLSFGGPAGQIAVMHRILVEEKKWVSENRFLHALNYCMLLPGPEAQQLITYIGWLMHGTAGGLVAGSLFVLPGFLSILALSIIYITYGKLAVVSAAFFGLKAAVLAVVAEAVVRIGKKALKNEVMVGIAAAAFAAIFFFNLPFPVIILSAGLIGYAGGKFWEEKFYVIKGHKTEAQDSETVITDAVANRVKPTLARSFKVAAIWLLIWFAPIGVFAFFLGGKNILVQEALFFSKTAITTFGGAYSVLAYIAQQAVHHFGWLSAREMLDGLGMAETTPGPLIQVIQFVGFLGAYRNPAPFSPMTAAILGSIVTTWVTYSPCFLWIFLGAPYIEHLRGNRSLSCALSGITAAVVGVILNLAIWFSLHVIFGTVHERFFGPLRLYIPVFSTLDWQALLIAAGAFFALFRLKWEMLVTLAVSLAAGVVIKRLTP